MIDVLLQIFGPQLAHKLFGDKNEITTKELADAIVEMSEILDANKIAIGALERKNERLQKEIRLLSPINIKDALDIINGLMDRQERANREELKRQQNWNYSLCVACAVALIFTAMRLFL